jgi:hypothetical protein
MPLFSRASGGGSMAPVVGAGLVGFLFNNVNIVPAFPNSTPVIIPFDTPSTDIAPFFNAGTFSLTLPTGYYNIIPNIGVFLTGGSPNITATDAFNMTLNLLVDGVNTDFIQYDKLQAVGGTGNPFEIPTGTNAFGNSFMSTKQSFVNYFDGLPITFSIEAFSSVGGCTFELGPAIACSLDIIKIG